MRGIAPTELERDATEHQGQQHGDDGRIKRRQDHAVGEREGRQQPATAQHEPGLVTVPHGSDGIHGAVAFLAGGYGLEQNADAEVEAIHDDIGEDREGDDEGEDRRKIEGERHDQTSLPVASDSATAGDGVRPAARTGAPRSGPCSPRCGG